MMSIEIAPKAPSAPVSNSVSTEDAGKPVATTRPDAKNGNSFLAILGLVDKGVCAAADGVISDLIVDGKKTPPLGAMDEVPVDISGAATQSPADTTVDPAALLAQLQLTPNQPPVPQQVSAEEASAAVGIRPAHVRRPDGVNSQAITTEGDSPKPVKTNLHSGKAVLDTSSQAANLTSAGRDDARQGTVLQPAEGKFALPESVVKAVREVATTLSKTPEAGTAAMSANRGKAQDALQLHKAPVNDMVLSSPTLVGGSMGVDGVTGNGNAASTNGQFSEQVKYWMGGDVQKAELTLDGLGASPVEVSISMQGNEAHVMFRTDEAQARDALASASAELKASLDRQGVLLSGVSVDTSSAGGQPPPQSGRQHSGWRTAKVEAAAPVDLTTRGKSAATSTGSSIDLFV